MAREGLVHLRLQVSRDDWRLVQWAAAASGQTRAQWVHRAVVRGAVREVKRQLGVAAGGTDRGRGQEGGLTTLEAMRTLFQRLPEPKAVTPR